MQPTAIRSVFYSGKEVFGSFVVFVCAFIFFLEQPQLQLGNFATM